MRLGGVVKITRRPDTETWLLDEMRRSFGDGARPEMHLSDLLNPRKGYWARVSPKPVTDDEIVYFLAGRGHEDVFGRISGLERGKPQRAFGIVYTVDFHKGSFCELKTRRRNLAPEGFEAERYNSYIEQCKGYCALERGRLATQHGVITSSWNHCELIVIALVQQQEDGSTKPEIGVYDLEFTEQELDDNLIELQQRAGTLEYLLQLVKNPDYSKHEAARLLPLCWDWMCGKRSSEMVTKPYCTTCKREFQTDWGIGKHVDSKTGRGHAVTKATYRYFYKPRCKYYSECQPFRDDPNRGGELGEGPTTEDGAE